MALRRKGLPSAVAGGGGGGRGWGAAWRARGIKAGAAAAGAATFKAAHRRTHDHATHTSHTLTLTYIVLHVHGQGVHTSEYTHTLAHTH